MKRIELVAEARTFAADKHKNQTDKNKDPYFNHLAAVAKGVQVLGGSLEEIAAAYLHDVVEDCKDVTYATLLDYGFPASVVRIVWAVTKVPNELQEDYLARIVMTGKGAMRVKVADLLHNLRPDRLASLPEYTRTRLQQKYCPALAKLLMELGYLETQEAQKTKLATNPVGTASGYTNYTGGYAAQNCDPGCTFGESSSYYSPTSLMVGDWPAKASSPIASYLDKDKKLYRLEDGSEWTSSFTKVRIWTNAAYKARKAKETAAGNPDWSPATETLSGAVVKKTTSKAAHTTKQVTTGKKKT